MRHAKSKSGFSTAEMLLATMILGLSMTLLANGASLIQSIYRRMLATADAQMILSQAETRLRNDLSMAEKYDPDSNGYVRSYYVSPYWYSLKVDGGILYKEGFSSLSPEPDEEPKLDQISLKNVRRLEDLQIPEAPVIKFDDNCFKVYGLRVKYQDKRTGNWETLCGSSDASKPQFVIRALQSVTTGE